jgi:hypothetical protein
MDSAARRIASGRSAAGAMEQSQGQRPRESVRSVFYGLDRRESQIGLPRTMATIVGRLVFRDIRVRRCVWRSATA